jgi:arylsulfatase A-like enzyme
MSLLRSRGPLLLVMLVSAGLLLALWVGNRNPRLSPAHPNIVLIVTDDQDPASLAHMPRTIELIAAQGVTFGNAFVASPLCVPSRISILRGQYLSAHRAMSPQEFEARGLDRQTMATMLKAAGYRTALVGKYLGSGASGRIPPGWDEWYTMLTHNVYYDYEMNENGKTISYGSQPDDYISAVIAAKAIDFIGRADWSRPFFLYVGTVAPHAPVTPPPGHENDFADVIRTADIEDDVSDKPEWVRKFRDRNAGKVPLPTDPAAARLGQAWHRQRLRALTSVDRMVEELVAALTGGGFADNTYVFYVSDNGDWISRHYPKSAKLSPYDDGIRVPMLASGPGVAKSAMRPEVVSTIDLLPTFAELAGVPAPPFADGRSLMPLLRAAGAARPEWRDAVEAGLGAIENWVWASYPPPYRLLRSATFKYIEYATGEREYYDLGADPDEMQNAYAQLSDSRKDELARKLAARVGSAARSRQQ